MSEHAEHRMHENSLDAYLAERLRLSARARQIYRWVTVHGRATDREIMRGLLFSDMNCIRPRVTELVQAGLLKEVARRHDADTGKTVRVVDVMGAQRELFA